MFKTLYQPLKSEKETGIRIGAMQQNLQALPKIMKI
jgi:hypothetical protein